MTNTESRLNKTARQSRIINELRATPTLRVNDLARAAGGFNRNRAPRSGRAGRGGQDQPHLWRGGALGAAGTGACGARIAAAGRTRPDRRGGGGRGESSDILAIGGGATTLHFARKLATARDHLTVITHAISIAVALAVNSTHKVLMLPGLYDGREGLIHGPDTLEALNRFHVNKAFLGARLPTRRPMPMPRPQPADRRCLHRSSD